MMYLTLPIDEMLIDLRGKLENLQEDATDDTLSEVFAELSRIGDYCENEFLLLEPKE